MKDPKLQLLRMAAKRAELSAIYGPFCRARGLTAAQASRLLDALAQHETRVQDIETVGRAQRLRSNDPALSAQREAAVADLRAAEFEILGDGGSAALRAYERTLPLCEYVGALAGVAVLSGMPFTAEQADELTLVLAQANPRYAKNGKVELNGVDWSAADVAARAVLSPEQWAMFTRVNLPITGQGRFSPSSEINNVLLKYLTATSMRPGN
jgi:hypothetical protein